MHNWKETSKFMMEGIDYFKQMQIKDQRGLRGFLRIAKKIHLNTTMKKKNQNTMTNLKVLRRLRTTSNALKRLRAISKGLISMPLISSWMMKALLMYCLMMLKMKRDFQVTSVLK